MRHLIDVTSRSWPENLNKAAQWLSALGEPEPGHVSSTHVLTEEPGLRSFIEVAATAGLSAADSRPPAQRLTEPVRGEG